MRGFGADFRYGLNAGREQQPSASTVRENGPNTQSCQKSQFDAAIGNQADCER